jgi:hypothetical protein
MAWAVVCRYRTAALISLIGSFSPAICQYTWTFSKNCSLLLLYLLSLNAVNVDLDHALSLFCLLVINTTGLQFSD